MLILNTLGRRPLFVWVSYSWFLRRPRYNPTTPRRRRTGRDLIGTGMNGQPRKKFACLPRKRIGSDSFRVIYSPRPLFPTKRKSLNRATCFTTLAVSLRTSPLGLSSFPAATVTAIVKLAKHVALVSPRVPSGTGVRRTTTKGQGRDLFDRQWGSRRLQKILGLLDF